MLPYFFLSSRHGFFRFSSRPVVGRVTEVIVHPTVRHVRTMTFDWLTLFPKIWGFKLLKFDLTVSSACATNNLWPRKRHEKDSNGAKQPLRLVYRHDLLARWRMKPAQEQRSLRRMFFVSHVRPLVFEHVKNSSMHYRTKTIQAAHSGRLLIDWFIVAW